MVRFGSVAFATLVLAVSGCTWPFKKTDPSPFENVTGSTSSPPLLIGPDSGGHVAPTELPAKQASVACLAAARELDKNGKVPEAIQLYEKARQQDPALSPSVSRRLAVLYDLANEFEKATVEYEQQLQASPRDPQLLNDVGYSYYCRGDFARAEEYLTQATKLDPNLKRAWLNLGLTLAASGRPEQGLNAFARAGTEAQSRANLGFVYATQGKVQEAKEQYKRALTLEPGFTLARVALERLENPPPADAKKDAGVVRADGRRSKFAVAEDVPSIFELEERIKTQEAAKQQEGQTPQN